MLHESHAPSIDPLNHLADARLPSPRAVLLAGPLGSGKTTLLNHLLERSAQNPTVGSILVIENDIGSRNTDAARLSARPEDVLAITAGCICCNDLHSLSAAIAQIKAAGGYQTLFIETTGIANPGAVKDLLHDAGIPTKTIVTVDVKHFERNRMLRRDADTVPHADIVALTWWEGGVSPETIAQTIAAIQSENDTAPLLFVSSTGRPLPAPPGDISLTQPKSEAPLNLDPLTPCPPTFAPLNYTEALQLPSRPISDVTHRHQTFAVTLAPPPGIRPEILREIVAQGVGAGLLLRAKGHLDGYEFDCTHGDWRFYPRDRGYRRNTITIMSDQPLSAARFPGLTPLASDLPETLDLSDPTIRDRAVELVQELLERIPADVIVGDRLITETDAAEAWRYFLKPGFPAQLRDQFLRSLLDFYLRQHTALLSGRFDTSTALPYYKREVGSCLSGFAMDCGAELDRWEMRTHVTGLQSCTLYFEGLAQAKTALHIGSLREADMPYLQRRLETLATEIGVERSRALAKQAIENCARLSLNGSWDKALRLLTE